MIKILLGDDDEFMLRETEQIVKSIDKKFEILKALNGEETCELAIKESPDLIIIDWLMQEISGIDLIPFLKQQYTTKDIPIIILTKTIRNSKIKEALGNNSVDYVFKPVKEIDLISRIKNSLVISKNLNEIKEKDKLIESQNKRLLEDNVEMKMLTMDLEKLSIAASKSNNSVIIFNPEGKIKWVSEGFIKLYGYNLSMFKQLRGRTIYSTNGVSNIKEYVEECKKTLKSISFRKHITDINKNKRWLKTTIIPIMDDGKLSEMVAVESDISELTATEDLLLQEKNRADRYIKSILPNDSVKELKKEGKITPRKYHETTILYTDFHEFNKVCEGLNAEDIVNEIDTYFSEFETITKKHYIERLNTIGDAFIGIGGIPIRNKSNTLNVILAGLEIQRFMQELNRFKSAAKLPTWQLKIAIHTGELVAGVVGKEKFSFNVWGESINIIKDVESVTSPGGICVSETTYNATKDYFDFVKNNDISSKSNKTLSTYHITGIKNKYSSKSKFYPNDKLINILSKI